MAMLKKSSRLITVDGVRYLWRVRNRPTYFQGNGWTPLILAVERADIPGARMVVELPQAHPNNWMGKPVVALFPSDVADYVRSALAAGWPSNAPGKPFLLTL